MTVSRVGRRAAIGALLGMVLGLVVGAMLHVARDSGSIVWYELTGGLVGLALGGLLGAFYGGAAGLPRRRD